MVFTIIKDLPYDRHKTTMSDFVMCKDCNSEYTNILDRRFHAQPIACEICGPEYSLYIKKSSLREKRSNLMNRNETYKLLFGHAPEGQAINTRYFVKNKMSSNKCLNPSCNL